MAEVRVLLRVFVLIMALSVGVGCGQGSDSSQALEEQQQKNEEQRQENKELQEKLAAQEEQQQEEEEKREAAAKQEEMQQEIEDLKQKVEENGGEPQETDQPEAESPEVVIETAPPSQAPQGTVVVSPGYDVEAVTVEEEQALYAAIDYYEAVEVGDYYRTHELLCVDDQNFYPVDVWVAANTNLDSEAGEFVVTDAYPADVGNGYPTYAVTLTLYLPDGNSSPRTTYFTNEGNGYWAHWLSDEEEALFNGAV